MMNGFEGSESQKLTHRVVKVNLEIQFTSRIEICQVKGACVCILFLIMRAGSIPI